ncbi:MATE family efflux transporter [Pseudoalteromonas piscicida]|uniref:MATE family efflux transporter n=1 Tax=Pseudoalteromonas piscicida TaxID=43662 RepID=UPI0030B704AB
MKDKKPIGPAQLSEMPILPLFVKTSIPIGIGLLIVGLYALVDGWFVSRYISEQAFGAVAMVFPLQMLVVAITAMVSSGMAATMTKCIGAKKDQQAAEVIGHGFILGGLISIVFLVLGWLYPLELLSLLEVEPAFLHEAIRYFQPLYLFAVTSVLLPIVADMFRGQGKPQLMMLILLVSALLNIALDYLFIATLNLGVAGAAYATIVAQSFALLVAVVIKRKVPELLSVRFCWRPQDWVTIVAIGMPILVTQCCLGWQTALVNVQLLTFASKEWVIAHGMLSRIINFAILPAIAMLIAFQTIVGYNLAAGKINRVKTCTRIAFFAITGFSLLLTLVLMGLPKLWLHWFTETEALLDIGEQVLRSALWGMPLLGVMLLASGFYQAKGDAARACFYSGVKVIFLMTPLMFMMPSFFDLTGVFVALVGADFLAAMITLWLCWRHYRQYKNEQEEVQFAAIN